MPKKIAVILGNLGGPDSLKAVKPFLFNLFYDPAIIRLPAVFRFFLAKLISTRRAPIAKEIYRHMGGKSPILEETILQQIVLEKLLTEQYPEIIFKTFICMRYWHPFAEETIKQVNDFAPDEIFLLPLYPQFSTTTTASFFKKWQAVLQKSKSKTPVKAMCCYPKVPGFVTAYATLIREHLPENYTSFQLVFSAHGLPEKVIKQGDPYQWQVEETAKSIIQELNLPNIDWVVAFQSRVGPLAWIGPSTEETIIQAGKAGKNLIVVPIAFVSEHSETLVELDIEYKKLAEDHGVKQYIRVPAVRDNPVFIRALAGLCAKLIAISSEKTLTVIAGAEAEEKQCPKDYCACLQNHKIHNKL